jgi:translocation and assembly module TamA
MDTAQQIRRVSFTRLNRLALFLFLFCCAHLAGAAPVVDVKIEGIEGDLRQNVEQLLSIMQQREHPLLTVGRIKRLHQMAGDEIRTALKPYGYYHPDIEKELKQISDEHWQAVYRIDPGEAIRLDSVSLELLGEGRDDPELKALFDEFPLKKGDRLNQVEYETAKSTIVQTATELGYFEYRFVQHRINVDPKQNRASLKLKFDSGPRYHFGAITFRQNALDDTLLHRYLPFAEGDPYSVRGLIDLQHALSNSDYFQDIEIEPRTGINPAHEVPVTVTLTPRKPNKYTFGLGYGSDTQARGKIGWAVPRVNRYGHRFDTELKASHISKSASANYRIPVGDPTTEQLAFNAAVIESTTDTSESLIRNIGASLTKTPYRWRQILSLNYQYEGYTVAGQRDVSVLLIPGISWNRAWADDFSHVRRGIRVELGLRGANKEIISETNFFQVTGGGKLITSLSPADRIILRGQAGRTFTQHFDQLPASVRFFTGGSKSVRGYSYQSLGPKNAAGDVVGGRLLLVGSAEFEHSLNADWAAAIFYDAGNAIDNMKEKLERGTGFGLRWQTPIGPASFDIAWPISRHGKPRLQINIGPDL